MIPFALTIRPGELRCRAIVFKASGPCKKVRPVQCSRVGGTSFVPLCKPHMRVFDRGDVLHFLRVDGDITFTALGGARR